MTTFVSVTSFNEWHEGTQIEPAVQKMRKIDHPLMKVEEAYMDYSEGAEPTAQAANATAPDMYLVRTKRWADALDRYNVHGNWGEV